MSSSSFAALRKHPNHFLSETAQKHFQQDLQQEDRDALQSAASSVSTHAAIGSIIGIGLGLLLATRIRGQRARMFQAFKTSEKPTQIVFEGGRTEPIPDITPLIKPTPLGDFAAYTFFAAGGLFLGGELGFLTGSYSGGRKITENPESRQRIEEAFRRFRIEIMQKQLQELERGSKAGLEGLTDGSGVW